MLLRSGLVQVWSRSDSVYLQLKFNSLELDTEVGKNFPSQILSISGPGPRSGPGQVPGQVPGQIPGHVPGQVPG